jgi:hypothetical protein
VAVAVPRVRIRGPGEAASPVRELGVLRRPGLGRRLLRARAAVPGVVPVRTGAMPRKMIVLSASRVRTGDVPGRGPVAFVRVWIATHVTLRGTRAACRIDFHLP